jgi:hypothetical protein
MLGHRFGDQDVERLFNGETPDSQALATLSPILSSIQSVSWPSLSEERVARFASRAAKLALTEEPRPTLNFAVQLSKLGWLPSLSRGLAIGVASILVISGMTAVAIASDDAAPGDALYGIDRALEAVGIGDGAAAERIAEARALFDRGQVTEAIEHASEALDVVPAGDSADFSPESTNAAAALHTAADSVQAQGATQSQDVRDAVAAMLAEMAAMIEDPALEGRDFGQKVAEMAGAIGGKDNPGPSENPLGPPGSPPGKPDGTPGQPDNTTGQSDGASTGPQGRP